MATPAAEAGSTSIGQWIREVSPSVAFYSNSKGGGFIGKRALKSVLAARAGKELGKEYTPQGFSESWELLLKQGFVQQLIERGKPKGVAGASTAPSPVPAKASMGYTEMPNHPSTAGAFAPHLPAPDTTVAAHASGLAKTTPVRFGPTAAPGPLPAPSLVTPGGSLTAETARELAAFGGAVIRRGASAQVNIAIPQSRLRGTSSTVDSISSSAFSPIPIQSSQPSTPPRAEAYSDSTDNSARVRASSLSQSQISPPEPAQPWKSLEVSLVDASLMRGFGPGLAVPGPTTLPPLEPLAASMSTTATAIPSIRREATLPVPPSHPITHSAPAQLRQLHHISTNSDTAADHSFGPQLHQHTQSTKPHSEASTAAYTPSVRPSTSNTMNIPQSQSPLVTPYYHPGPHNLSRQNSMSPNVIYNPPLRLSEISLPYKVQYHIFALLLSTLEFVFYDFSSKWFPEILNNNCWDCPEAAEVTTWSASILQALNSASGEVQVTSSGTGRSPTTTRAKVNRKPQPQALAHLTKLLQNVKDLHQDASRRTFISGEKLLAHLDSSVRVSSLLGCTTRASELEEITYYVKEALGGIGIVRETVRSSFQERMEMISRKRDELMRLEQETLKEASRLEREQCTKLGLDLMSTLEPKFAKMEWAARPNRPRRNSWKEPSILSGEKTSLMGDTESFFPPVNTVPRKNSMSVRKDKAADKTSTPTTPSDRGRNREPRMSISTSKNPSPTTPTANDIPPAIPAKAAKRVSRVYPPATSILDYDSDIEHEREGPGGVGLEFTMSQSGLPNTAASSGSLSIIKRKDQGTANQALVSDARPVTPAQVNMVREPVPQATPVPISKLIEEEDTFGGDIRRNGSTKSMGNPFLNLHLETVLPVVERGQSVPASANRVVASGKTCTPPAGKRHSAGGGGGGVFSNTGPTPPLTPKENKSTAAQPGQNGAHVGTFFEGQERWNGGERNSVVA